MTSPQKFFIAAGSTNWVQDDDFLTAIKKLDEISGRETYTIVFEIEGDPKMLYDFKNWVPQIDGARFIAKRQFKSNENKDGFEWIFPEEITTVQLEDTNNAL